MGVAGQQGNNIIIKQLLHVEIQVNKRGHGDSNIMITTCLNDYQMIPNESCLLKCILYINCYINYYAVQYFS